VLLRAPLLHRPHAKKLHARAEAIRAVVAETVEIVEIVVVAETVEIVAVVVVAVVSSAADRKLAPAIR